MLVDPEVWGELATRSLAGAAELVPNASCNWGTSIDGAAIDGGLTAANSAAGGKGGSLNAVGFCGLPLLRSCML